MSKFICGQFDIQIIKKKYFLKSMDITAINFLKSHEFEREKRGYL